MRSESQASATAGLRWLRHHPIDSSARQAGSRKDEPLPGWMALSSEGSDGAYRSLDRALERKRAAGVRSPGPDRPPAERRSAPIREATVGRQEREASLRGSRA